MTADAIAIQHRKWSVKPENENGLKTVTVECLRGRLLAERAVSRNAKLNAEQIENKLAELEKRLKEETKSRNRAEKTLKSLMKKLEPLNLSYAFDKCEHSDSMEKSEISFGSSCSSSSVISSNTKQTSEEVTTNVSDSTTSDIVESIENSNSGDLQQFASENHGESLISPFGCAAQSIEDEAAGTEDDTSKMEDHHGLTCSGRKEEDYVDNSMALVVVDKDVSKEKEKQRIDPEILDATVKEVLDALRNAKEKLQTSMERRCMIQVG